MFALARDHCATLNAENDAAAVRSGTPGINPLNQIDSIPLREAHKGGFMPIPMAPCGKLCGWNARRLDPRVTLA